MGVRTDVPFNELTPKERDIVFNGPAEKKHILYKAKKSDTFAELDFTYYNAVYTVENALAKVKDEKGLARVAQLPQAGHLPRVPRHAPVGRRAEAAAWRASTWPRPPRRRSTASRAGWTAVPGGLPTEMRPMARNICESFQHTARRLVDLGLGYLSLDRAGSTLSTGERQRVQLARAVRNRTTGVLYVLDEPSIGLHPANVDGLVDVMRDLLADGNSVVMVDHDARILRETDCIVEMGPGAGAARRARDRAGQRARDRGRPRLAHRAVSVRSAHRARARPSRRRPRVRPGPHPSGNGRAPHREAP